MKEKEIEIKLGFHGGAKQVTGANYLLEIGRLKLLIDCGLFQGYKYAEVLNTKNSITILLK